MKSGKKIEIFSFFWILIFKGYFICVLIYEWNKQEQNFFFKTEAFLLLPQNILLDPEKKTYLCSQKKEENEERKLGWKRNKEWKQSVNIYLGRFGMGI